MQPFFINIFWQVLLVIAAIALFSFIVLSIALYIQTGIKGKRKSYGNDIERTSRQQPKTVDIMGTSGLSERQSQPNNATERQKENREETDYFAREIPARNSTRFSAQKRAT